MSGRYEYKRPVYSFHPHSFSFDIDNNDEKLKLTLRRASLTGLTPHPISRQLSDKVDIPIEDEETSSSDIFLSSGKDWPTTKITLPEYPEVENNARRSANLYNLEKTPKKSPVRKLTPVKVQHVPDKTRSKLHATLGEKSDTQMKNNHKTETKYDPQKYKARQNVGTDNDKAIREISQKSTDSIRKNLKKFVLNRTNKSLAEKESDKVKLEKEFEKEIESQDKFMKQDYKLHRFLIIPDGNCVYRAIAQAVLLDQSQHMLLRQLAVEHIQEHKEEFESIIEEDFESFLKAALLEGEWGGYAEILALSRLLDINIMITTGGTSSNPNVHTRLHYFETGKDAETKKSNSASKKKSSKKYIERKSIWLSWLSSGHYDAFLEDKIENPCYNEWLQSRDSRIKSDAKIANQLYSDDLNRQELEKYHQYSTENFSNQLEQNADGQFYNDNYGLDDVLPPQYYPPSTYPRNAANTSRFGPPPPYSVLDSSTDFDEAIAMSLQNEEKFDEDDSYYA